MDFPSVEAQLNDLPDTFKRRGPWYTQLIDSVSMEMSRFTLGEDATFDQVLAYGFATDGWLDLWGQLWGVPREVDEANTRYEIRIQRTVLAWVGTVPAIETWLDFYAPGGTVTENDDGLGYVLDMPATTTLAQIVAFLVSFNRIRPAGVPFTIRQSSGGPYLGTTEHLGQGILIGAYLSTGTRTLALPIGPGTPNALPLLPTVYLTDPLLGNPGLFGFANSQTRSPSSLKTATIKLPPSPPVPPAPPFPFWNNGGNLSLIDRTSLPLTETGLLPGDFWSNGGEVNIVPGSTPVSSPPLFYASLTIASLVTAGGASLPTSNPGAGTLQVWNNGDVACVA